MKKITLIMLLLLILSLSGCSNKEHLINAYFVNEEDDDISVLWDVLNEYDRFISDSYEQYLGSTYPRDTRSIQHLNDYVLYDQTGKIYKEDMINYDLTDNRSYLIEGSDIYFYRFDSWISIFEDLYCDDIQEGVKCYATDQIQYLLYYVDGDEAYVEYNDVINGTSEHLQKMYYYTNELNEKVFEYTHYNRDIDQIEYDYITKTTLIEGVGEIAYTCALCNISERTGWLKYSAVNFFTGDRKYIYQGEDDFYMIKLLDGRTNKFYWGTVSEGQGYLELFEAYEGKIKLVELNPFRRRFTINLNALDGWSYIEKQDAHPYELNYHLYDENELLIDNILVRLVVTEGDYAYYDYDGEDSIIPDDILNMSRFGLEAPYSMDYFLDQEQYFMHIYPLILEIAHMDRTFDMSYNYFMKMMDLE